jgi:hypothetical protein
MNVYRPERRRFWEKHIEKWKVAGVSQVQYCRQNEINIKSFQYWKRRIGRLGCIPTLVEVPLLKSAPVYPSSFSPQLCLVVDQHYRIEMAKGFDPGDLENVVRVLGRV